MQSKSRLKLMTFVGTRPEIIRLSRVLARADEYFDHLIVHTGQNYDYELNQVFFEDLELRKPDHFLNIDTSSLGSAVGDIIKKSEDVLKKEKPDAVLVLGDTNSCLAAYMAKRLHIPIFHMEAGNRCYDFNVPEETNRRIIDHIADFNLVYTEHARRHLISEGLPHRRIYLTGSPMNEVIHHYLPKIRKSEVLKELKLEAGKYFIISAHREENVDAEENLKVIVESINELADTWNYPVIVSTHPRTRKRLENLSGFTAHSLVSYLKPFGFVDYVYLQMNAACAISDSGTISEESAILNFPAVTLRNSMERPEALDCGSIIVTGINREVLVDSVKLVMEQHSDKSRPFSVPADYQIQDTSWRVIKLIQGTTHLSGLWHALRRVQ
jgi:UDP-N-acetylglucosamine 2-epimerase (non-hydrolysing)